MTYEGRMLSQALSYAPVPGVERYGVAGVEPRIDSEGVCREMSLVQVGGLSVAQTQPSQR